MKDNFGESLPNRHDLSLPCWGPYSKKHFGISHIADNKHGHRVDFTAIPGFYRRQLGIPDSLRPSGYLPWNATADLEDYSFRQQLEWKDRAYADISFSKINDNLRLVRCVFANNTELPSDFALHIITALKLNPEESIEVTVPGGCWIDFRDCRKVSFAETRPTDGLNPDALRRGEERNAKAVGGSCLGKSFGQNAGDNVVFEFPSSPECVSMRFQLEGELMLDVNGMPVTLKSTNKEFQTVFLPKISGQKLVITSHGGCTIRIDGLALNGTPEFKPISANNKPRFNAGTAP